MKNGIKILFSIILTLCVATGAYAKSYKSEVETKRIPAGTKFQLQLLEPVSTSVGHEGDYFSAMLLGDQKTKTSIILPNGSVVRGTIKKIVPSKRFSRGANLYLDFDHIVTPSGRQLPLDFSVCGNMRFTFDGGILVDEGYGEAVKKNWNKTVDITKSSTEAGVNAGSHIINGVGSIITVPICAIGGAIGGGFYFLGDSVIDMFRKGSDVTLNQGTVLDVILTQPIDVPVS